LAGEINFGSLKRRFLDERSYYILHKRSEIDWLLLRRRPLHQAYYKYHHGFVSIVPIGAPGVVIVLQSVLDCSREQTCFSVRSASVVNIGSNIPDTKFIIVRKFVFRASEHGARDFRAKYCVSRVILVFLF